MRFKDLKVGAKFSHIRNSRASFMKISKGYKHQSVCLDTGRLLFTSDSAGCFVSSKKQTWHTFDDAGKAIKIDAPKTKEYTATKECGEGVNVVLGKREFDDDEKPEVIAAWIKELTA